MPIDVFDPLKPPATALPTDVTEARQAKTAEAVALAVSRGYRGVIDVHNGLMRHLWTNPLGLTPLQAAAAIGTRGAALYQLAQQVQQIAGLIAQQTGRDPMLDLTAPPAGWTMAGAEDGTLVLTPPTQE